MFVRFTGNLLLIHRMLHSSSNLKSDEGIVYLKPSLPLMFLSFAVKA